MTTQLYHLIPEPAGDWQEGDLLVSLGGIGPGHRLRPVKAQSGQLWRDKIIQEFADYLPIRLGGLPDSDIAEVTKIAAEVLADVLAVPAQPCACEGLREASIALLATRGCWWSEKNEPEIPEEISAKFDVSMALARQICNALSQQIHAPTTNLPVPGCDCEDCHPPAAAIEAQANSSVPEWYNIAYIVYDSDGRFAFNCANIEGAKTAAAIINATVAALRRELEQVRKALDENWVTHQRVVQAETDRDQWRNTAKGWETEVRMWADRCSRLDKQEQI